MDTWSNIRRTGKIASNFVLRIDQLSLVLLFEPETDIDTAGIEVGTEILELLLMHNCVG